VKELHEVDRTSQYLNLMIGIILDLKPNRKN